jgi:hypothetical protein
MSHVLGSQAETMTFTDNGIAYGPAGLIHAVDTQSPVNRPDALVGYAICGEGVLVWPDQPFDPKGPDVHDDCAAISRRD